MLLFYLGENSCVARILHTDPLGKGFCIAVQNRYDRLISALGINYTRVDNSKIKSAQEGCVYFTGEYSITEIHKPLPLLFFTTPSSEFHVLSTTLEGQKTTSVEIGVLQKAQSF